MGKRLLYKLGSAKAVEAIKTPGMHSDGHGLYLRVAPAGSRGWIFRYKRRDMGLGSFPAVELAEARKKAADARELIRNGIDPIDHAKAADGDSKRRAVTFDEAAAAYVEAHKAGWKHQKTPKRWLATLARYASPVFGKRDVAGITVDDVLRVLSPIWATKNETAITLRGRIEAVLDFAKAKKWRGGENPAMWRGNLKHLLPPPGKVHEVTHHPALPWQDVPAFMAELATRDALAARALEVTILCATRTAETLDAERSELVGKLWIIPGIRTKPGKEHRIPLSRQATAIFAALPVLDEGPYLFPGRKRGRPLSGMAMEMLLRRMGRDDITVHGFRSTFRDWTAEQTNFPREIAELALSHVVGSAVERAYRRSDLLEKRRALMQAWADFAFSGCDKLAREYEALSVG